jgi:eukaryotic-like serine/threonine-protein kinase
MPDTPIDGRSLPGGVPTTLGKYTLLVRLAAGGMGEVYLARMSAVAGFEKNVVIKRLLPQFSQDEQFVRMFLDEARLTARLSHPNICQVFELIEYGDEYYLVMEYLEGLPLSRMATSCAPLGMDLRMVGGIMVQACEGLAYAHEFRDPAVDIQGIIHRDVSPHNLMVTSSGLVKLLDFGVAKLHREGSLTVTGSAKGKYAYMSPEQIECHPLDRRSDLFSLGVVMFELITGMRLFRHNSDLATLQAIVTGTRPRLTDVRPDVPDAVERVVDRALSVNRDHRFSTARLLADAFTHALAPLGGPAPLGELARFLATEHIIDLESQRALIATASTRLDQDRDLAAQPAAYTSSESSRSSRRIPLPLEAPSDYTRPLTGSGARMPSASFPALPLSAPALEPALPIAAAPPIDAAAALGAHTGLTEMSGVAVPDLSPSGSRIWLPLLIGTACAVGLIIWWQGREGAVEKPVASASSTKDGPEDRRARAPEAPTTLPSRTVEPLEAHDTPGAAGQDDPGAARTASGDSRAGDTARASEPTGSQAEAGESQPGKSQPGKSQPGKRRSKPRPRDTAQTSRASSASPSQAAEKGYFTVDALPYATIYIGQRKLGVTPLVRVELSAGAHSVRAVSSDGQVKTLQIHIGPGETTKKRILFD